MKKISILLLILLIVCCGCEYKYAKYTKTIRHSGFTLSGNSKFKCSTLLNNEEGVKEKVRLYSNGVFITEAGYIYKVTPGTLFSNDMNCMKPEFDHRVLAIYVSGGIIKADDGRYYYLDNGQGVVGYTEVTREDKSYPLYDLLLRDNSVLKVTAYNSKTGDYYVLKTDGNIYNYNITQQNGNYILNGTRLVYNTNSFGEEILDFNDNGSNGGTYFKTKHNYYRMLVTNKEECYKYGDVTCEYELKKDTGLSESYDYIYAFNGGTLITTYGRVFGAVN